MLLAIVYRTVKERHNSNSSNNQTKPKQRFKQQRQPLWCRIRWTRQIQTPPPNQQPNDSKPKVMSMRRPLKNGKCSYLIIKFGNKVFLYRNDQQPSNGPSAQIEEIENKMSDDEIEIDTELPCKIEPTESADLNTISKVSTINNRVSSFSTIFDSTMTSLT